MKLTGNTIFITGGSSGIGRGLAEALHKLGNKVIVSGRRKHLLDEVTKANPGIESLEMDVEDPASIKTTANSLIKTFPKLNVLINNAGIMKYDEPSGMIDDAVLISTITTNLLGPIRLTSALIEHLKSQPSATVINVTSGLAFTPFAQAAIYSATKAALHSYTMSQRYRLNNTKVKVLELAPPYVQTDLLDGANDPRAMKLDEFIAEAIAALETDNDEVLVERVTPLRNNAGPNEFEFVAKFNDLFKDLVTTAH